MNAQWLVDRTRLRSLLTLRPNWSIQDFADALGRSRAWVKKWRKRLQQAAPDDDASSNRSRARATRRRHAAPSL